MQAEISKRIAIIRIAFGVIWGIDAAFKFEPAFYRGILDMVKSADGGEPGWLNPWFHGWYHIIGAAPSFFAWLVIIIEIVITLSLLLGVARRWNYILGAVFSFLIWSVAEGFGGPYVSGSTDIGAGFIYVFVFALLFVSDRARPAWSLDPLLEKRISWWHYLSAGRR